MTLAEFVKATSIPLDELAAKIGDCSVSGLRKWINRERIPQKDQMERIVAATDGQVLPNDFYDLPKAEAAE